jgi:hypothetical protein
MSIADDLQTAGLVVIETRRPNIGRTVGVSGVEVRSTNTGRSHEGAGDINNVVKPAGGVAYVERSGRVWLLADGPVGHGPAVVYQAKYRADDELESDEAVAVVVAVLESVYAADAPGNVAPVTETPVTEGDDSVDEDATAKATEDEG